MSAGACGTIPYTSGMGEEARKLLLEALRLPLQERAELAADLLASMDGEPDEDVEQAWAAEAERRVRCYLSGQDSAGDWETLRSELRSEYGS